MITWHSQTTSADQGLIIDDETGRNVAVSYDAKDAKLIAAAPELLEVLKALLECPDYKNIHTHEMRQARWLVYTLEN